MMRRLLSCCLLLMLICLGIAGCTGDPKAIRIVSLGKPVRAGDVEIFTVIGTDAKGTKSPVSAVWELQGDNGLLLQSSGHAAYVFALAPGSSMITARKGELQATAEFSVYEPALERLVMLDNTNFMGTTLKQGQKCSLFVVGYDQFGREMKIDPVWSVTDELGSFSKTDDTGWRSNVTFEAIKAGNGTITASQDGKSATCSIIVLPVIVIGGR